MNIMKVTTIAGIAAALALGVGACGGSTSAAAPAKASPVVASPAPKVTHTAPALTDPTGLTVDSQARIGHPFNAVNDHTDRFRVTLVSVKHGLSPAVVAWAQDMLSGTPKARPGRQFVVVKFRAKNTGSANNSFDPNLDSVTVNAGGKAYEQSTAQTTSAPLSSDIDLGVDYGQYAQSQGVSSIGDSGLNPGDSGVVWGVYELPKHATITSLTVPVHFDLSAVMVSG
jgi:hypothetical protein